MGSVDLNAILMLLLTLLTLLHQQYHPYVAVFAIGVHRPGKNQAHVNLKRRLS
jgi:hypothetical protein